MSAQALAWQTIVCCMLLALLLSGCSGAPLLASEAGATAVALGCWPDTAFPTPLPVTVTATPGYVGLSPTPDGTPRATTTALPRCTPLPGETDAPWPTPLPTRPPFPTQDLQLREWESAAVAIVSVPDPILAIDLAVHPREGWPVVAAIAVPLLTRMPARVFVRAFNPRNRHWEQAQTVDLEGSHPGRNFRSVTAGIAPDGTIFVVWGSSDWPGLRLFVSESHDYGRTWSRPASLGEAYFHVLDSVAGIDGHGYVLATARRLDDRSRELAPVLITRTPDGHWQERAIIPAPFWFASSGALLISGEGTPDAALVALITAGEEAPPGTVYLARRPLAGGDWIVRSRAPDRVAGALTAHARGVAYTVQRDGSLRNGLTFTVVLREGVRSVYAVTSLDGGHSWGPMELVADAHGQWLGNSSVAYDPAADRLVVIWTCCQEAAWGDEEATHYASWRAPGRGWSPAPGDERVPLVSGARAAGLSTMAQSANGRYAWLAWVEEGQIVRARTLALGRVLPQREYPTPTPHMAMPEPGQEP